MFEQNGQSGYVLKPAVTWDKSHVMYNHFNPLDKEFDGLHTTVLTLHVREASINGTQFLCNTNVLYNLADNPLEQKNTVYVISFLNILQLYLFSVLF